MAGVTVIPGPADGMDVAWVRRFRGERRVREQAVLASCVTALATPVIVGLYLHDTGGNGPQ
jgi:hypothetical protein